MNICLRKRQVEIIFKNISCRNPRKNIGKEKTVCWDENDGQEGVYKTLISFLLPHDYCVLLVPWIVLLT